MAVTYSPGTIGTITAAAALGQKKFIGFDGNLCGAGAKSRGVTDAAFESGEEASIVETGEAVVTSAGTVALGGPVKSDANGEAIAQGGTGEINGYALNAVTAGQDLAVLLT